MGTDTPEPSLCKQRLFDIALAKFGDDFNFAYMIMGMSYFEDAEDEALPRVFVPADWQEIKRFFRQEQAVLLSLAQARMAGNDMMQKKMT